MAKIEKSEEKKKKEDLQLHVYYTWERKIDAF